MAVSLAILSLSFFSCCFAQTVALIQPALPKPICITTEKSGGNAARGILCFDAENELVSDVKQK